MDFTSLLHTLVNLVGTPLALGIILGSAIVIPEIVRYAKLSRAAAAGQTNVEGCFRLGLVKRSNLGNQFKRAVQSAKDRTSTSPRIKALFTYPVKSCKGIELAASEVGATGLKYDRLFTFAQLVTSEDKSTASTISTDVNEVSADWKHEWRFITQREFPRLALLETELMVPDTRAQHEKQQSDGSQPATDLETDWLANGGCLIIRFPFGPDFNPFGLRTETVTIQIPLLPTPERAEAKQYTSERLIVWKDKPLAYNVTNEIPADDLSKLKYFLGVSNTLALFRVDPSNYRAVTRSLPSPKFKAFVGFCDAFPLHMLNLASIRAIDDELPATGLAKGKLDARRFRANIYLTGPPAFAEDRWKRIEIGKCVQSPQNPHTPRKDQMQHDAKNRIVEVDGEYSVACRTARCKLPNVDPDTGIKDNNEPLTTLSRTRKVDKGAYPHAVLGVQMIPLFKQGLLKVGDEIRVVKTGEHVYEKMFA